MWYVPQTVRCQIALSHPMNFSTYTDTYFLHGAPWRIALLYGSIVDQVLHSDVAQPEKVHDPT